jgi:uncharacterized protein (TIGR02118 family)
MAKIIALIQEPKNKEAFDKHYFDIHVPLVRKIPGVKNHVVKRVIQTQNTNLNLYLLVEVEFESLQALDHAMASPEGLAVTEDGKLLSGHLFVPPIISIVE